MKTLASNKLVLKINPTNVCVIVGAISTRIIKLLNWDMGHACTYHTKLGPLEAQPTGKEKSWEKEVDCFQNLLVSHLWQTVDKFPDKQLGRSLKT